MLNIKKYELHDAEWNLDNVNAKIAELDADINSVVGNWRPDALEVLENLCLNRSGNGSRFPEWFSDIQYPERFGELMDAIFCDFDIELS